MTKMKVKKQKKKVFHKKTLKFEDYKHCLEATQLEYKINQLEKDKLDLDSVREIHKEFIYNNKLNNNKEEARNKMYLLKKLTRLC